ncbi:MAG: AAA family ATPase, partial [Planctomycetota bacterium]
KPAVFVFHDAHPFLDDPVNARKLKEVASDLSAPSSIVLVGPSGDIPTELESLAYVWRLRPPDREELRQTAARTLRDLEKGGLRLAIDAAAFEAMVDALAGLSIREAERLIQRVAFDDGEVDESDVPRLRQAKAELLAADGALELFDVVDGGLDRVGGLDALKGWLDVRKRAIDSGGADSGLEPLRGILLTGIPGCGKSFMAKAIAASWERPLVLFDPARLYSKYLGESEERLAKTLATVDALAPAVLWIDEIEKGFSDAGDRDGGASKRLLGTFLRWLQERTADVFLVATANDVAALPPELTRKGRLDEIFFVGLPDHDTRRRILALHLDQRGLDGTRFDLEALAFATSGFSGAELETAIVASLYRAVAAGEQVEQDDLLAEINATVPLSESHREDVAALEAWAATRAVPA